MKLTRLLLAGLLLAACGDDDDDASDQTPTIDGAPAVDGDTTADAGSADAALDAAPPAVCTDDLLVCIRALPIVAAAEEQTTDLEGYRAFDIQVRQPVDHAHPTGPTFLQYVTLIARDVHAPFVLATSGYGNSTQFRRVELTRLLNANQLAVEHRFFDPSIPENADWDDLTVRQSADDFHAITAAFQTIFDGAWIGTGASKGGMTSVYHRRFYPDDLAGTVAYVAPHSTSVADPRYDEFLNAVVPQDCMDAVHAAQVEMLQHRRAMLETKSMEQATEFGIGYTLVDLPAAVELGVIELEFSFWQYGGVRSCDEVPAPDATDDAFWAFYNDHAGTYNYSDDYTTYFAPYYFQAYHELGYPASAHTFLAGLTQFTDADYLGIFPESTQPAYDPTTMAGVGAWVKSEAEDILFIYGQYDPWTAGAFDLGDNDKLTKLVVAEGTHGANIRSLAAADKQKAFDLLAAWTGVTPTEGFAAGEKPIVMDRRFGLRRR